MLRLEDFVATFYFNSSLSMIGAAGLSARHAASRSKWSCIASVVSAKEASAP
jgi:hypothetical protein